MSIPKKVLGQIAIKFFEGGEPETEFTGKLDMINIQAAVYAIRTQFQFKYLDPIGEDLRKKAAKAVSDAAEKVAADAKKKADAELKATEISKKQDEAKNEKPINTESGKV